ncbi:MAG: carboxypeptidase-like regulatory domain-containing protein [Planctomycetia bacterium]|nr:carboxypeptidase-like regulatory domain-containing protein [Planctomycetia bacterium]
MKRETNQSKVRCFIVGLCCFMLACILSGCGNEFDLQNIKGTVTLDGAPVKGVSVMFAAIDGQGRDCGGYTDANGTFTMTSSVGKGGDGTSPGRYKVYFQKMVPVTDLPNGDPRKTQMAIAQSAMVESLPEKYLDKDSSEFEVEVVKGRNQFTFDLTSK